MDEFIKIIITAAFTIIGGISIFGITKVIERFQVDPIIELSNLRGEIATFLIINANQFGYPENKDKLNLLSFELRTLSAKLRGTVFKINFYWFYSLIRLIPKRKDVLSATSEMIGLSNSIITSEFSEIIKYRREIEKHLKLILD